MTVKKFYRIHYYIIGATILCLMTPRIMTLGKTVKSVLLGRPVLKNFFTAVIFNVS
jgi:hypothetical protein